MKILYVTTIGATMRFFTSFIKSLIEEGNTVEIATNERDGKVPDCYREWGCSVCTYDIGYVVHMGEDYRFNNMRQKDKATENESI